MVINSIQLMDFNKTSLLNIWSQSSLRFRYIVCFNFLLHAQWLIMFWKHNLADAEQWFQLIGKAAKEIRSPT